MNFELVKTAYAQAGEPVKKTAPMWPMLIAIFAVFYFFIIRPQKREQKARQQQLDTLQKGDKVIK